MTNFLIYNNNCRVCLTEKKLELSIFDFCDDAKYCDLIKEYLGLELINNNNLPSMICDDCITELNIVVQFVNKVRASVDTLNNFLKDIDKSDCNTTLIKDEEEEAIPLSVLGAALKKEKSIENTENSSNDFSYDDYYSLDRDDNISNEVFKEVPKIISLDKLTSLLSENKNNFECVTVNNITIKKERIESKGVLEKASANKIKPKKVLNKHSKKKSKLRNQHKSELDSKYLIMKAKDHGLTKDMLKCLTCGYMLYNRSSFIVHYRRHSGERPYQCKQCAKRFSQAGALNEHVRHVHLGIKRLKFKVDDKTPTSDPDENIKYKVLKAHEYELRKDKVQCLTCRLICENKSAFIVHYRKHSGERPFKCQHCDKCFPRVGTLNDHIKNIHSENKTIQNQNPDNITSSTLYAIIKAKDHPELRKDMVQCLTCRLLLNDKCAFRVHYRKHTTEKPYKCEQCSQVFHRMGDLNHHIKKIHVLGQESEAKTENREESCICYACGKKFKHKSSLTIHLRTHTDEKPHECSYCSKRFIRSQELSLHIRIHHTGEKPYSCHVCGKNFAAGTQLKSHLFVHTDEKNFKCKICSTAVKTRDSLAKHMRVMHTTRKNICDLCGAAFAFRYGLRDHMKNRHSDRSELCEICKKPFSDLQKHMITHSDQKPFLCHICQKGFFRQKSLKAHILKHHNNCVPPSYM